MRHEADRGRLAADHFATGVVNHGGGDDQLAALVVIGDDGGHVRHIAAVVFQVEAAAADHAPGKRTPMAEIMCVVWCTKRSVNMPPPKGQ